MRISSKTIIAQAVRDLDLKNTSTRINAMKEWCYEAEILIGTHNSYMRDECVLSVENFRAKLPDDFVSLISIKRGTEYLEHSSRDFVRFDKSSEGNLADTRSYNSIVNLNKQVTSELPKFYIENGFINVTIETGEIGISYLKIPIDPNGDIMIHQNHAEAVTAYLMWKYKTPEFLSGKLQSGIYNELKRRWFELVNNARGKDGTPSRKQMDYIGAIWNNLKVYPPKEIM